MPICSWLSLRSNLAGTLTRFARRRNRTGAADAGDGSAARRQPARPGTEISGAARYLRGLVGRFGTKHYDLVFAAYNAGPKAVSEYGGIPPFDETQNYVIRVLAAWERLSQTVRLPENAYAVNTPAGGADLDYWLEGPPTQ